MKDKRMLEYNQLSNDTGFTLVEVMIAMAIFAIGILAVGTMQMTAAQGNTSARMRSDALTIAVDRLEEYKVIPYEQLVDPEGHGVSYPYQITEDVNGIYTVVSRIRPNTPTVDSVTIEITVSWEQAGAKSLIVRLITADVV